jgi:hypothetical protein
LAAWDTTYPYIAKYDDAEDVIEGLLIEKGRMKIN